MYGYMAGEINYPEDEYADQDYRNVARVMQRALARDNQLTAEEYRAKDDALRECELGPNWWLRAHP